jgi:hypothetical protein
MGSFEDFVRPFQSPEKSSGHRPSPTNGLNSDPATLDVGEGDVAGVDPAVVRNDQVIDLNRWPVLNAAHGATEDVVIERSVNGSFNVDMNTSSIILLRVIGSSLTVNFASLPALPAAQQRSIWAARSRVITTQITINWLSAGTKTVNLVGVRFNDGDKPRWTTTAGSYDSILVQKFSSGLLLGYQQGQDLKVPS